MATDYKTLFQTLDVMLDQMVATYRGGRGEEYGRYAEGLLEVIEALRGEPLSDQEKAVARESLHNYTIAQSRAPDDPRQYATYKTSTLDPLRESLGSTLFGGISATRRTQIRTQAKTTGFLSTFESAFSYKAIPKTAAPTKPRTAPPPPRPVSFPNVTITGGGGGAPAAPRLSPNASTGEVEQFVRNNYPHLMWAMDIPELAKIIRRGATQGWDETRFEGALKGSKWWKTTSDSAREWARLRGEDPAEATRRIRAKKTDISTLAKSFGIGLGDGEAAELAEKSLKLGWTDTELRRALSKEYLEFIRKEGGERAGGAASIANGYKAIASEYAVPVSDRRLDQWVAQTIEGVADENTMRSYFVEQAKSLFPALADALDRGVTVRQYADPYLQIAANELGIDPDGVELTDRKWMRALNQVDAKTGEKVSMSLDDWLGEIRSNDIYGYDSTTNASRTAAQLGSELLKAFGAAA